MSELNISLHTVHLVIVYTPQHRINNGSFPHSLSPIKYLHKPSHSNSHLQTLTPGLNWVFLELALPHSSLLPTCNPQKSQSISKLLATKECAFAKRMAAATPAAVSSNFRFKNLKETFTVDVQRAENSPFDCPFYVGFVKIGEGGELTIIIELMGVWGWGEAPIFPFVIAEDQPAAMAKAADACAFLRRMGNDIGLDFGGDWLGSSWTRVCFWLLVPLTL